MPPKHTRKPRRAQRPKTTKANKSKRIATVGTAKALGRSQRRRNFATNSYSTTGPRVGISSPPMSSGFMRNTIRTSKGKMGNILHISGTEYIGAIVVPDGDATNAIVYQRQNVAAPPATRLAQFAAIYERWHPRKYTYRFTSSCPSTAPGSLIFAQEADPTRTFTNLSAGNVAALRVIPGSQMRQVWQNAECHITSSRDYTSLWTSDNHTAVDDADRLDLAGQLVVVTVVPSGLTAGTALGVLELDYEVDFFVPKLGEVAAARERTTRIVTPGAGAIPLIPSFSPRKAITVVNDAKRLFDTVSGSTGTQDALTQILKTFKTYPSIPTPPYSARRKGKIGYNLGRPTLGDAANFGCLPGQYTVRYIVCTNTAPTGYPVWTYVFATASDGCSFFPGPDLQVNPLTTEGITPTYTDPSGTVWNHAEEVIWEFGAASDASRCVYDLGIDVALEENLPADTVVWLQIASAASAVYLQLTPGAGTLDPLPKHGPSIERRHEGKEEKVDSRPPPLSVSDEEWEVPPTMRTGTAKGAFSASSSSSSSRPPPPPLKASSLK